MNPISTSPSAVPAASSSPNVCHPEAFAVFIEMLNSQDFRKREFASAMLAAFNPTKEQEESCIKAVVDLNLNFAALEVRIEHLSNLIEDGVTLNGRIIPVTHYPKLINVLKTAQLRQKQALLKERLLPLFCEFEHTRTTKTTPPANPVAHMARNSLFEPRVFGIVAEFLI